MKASELVTKLQYMIEEYGDLKVDLSHAPHENNGVVYGDDNIWLGYDQREDNDEYGTTINIRNFPY